MFQSLLSEVQRQQQNSENHCVTQRT